MVILGIRSLILHKLHLLSMAIFFKKTAILVFVLSMLSACDVGMWLEQRWLDNCIDVLPHKEALVDGLTEEIEGIETLSDEEEAAAI